MTGQTRDGVYGAVYEFQWPDVLLAVKSAHEQGAAVNVLFDNEEDFDKEGKLEGPWKKK